MAIIKSNSATTSVGGYRFEDYESQKNDYLKRIQSQAAQLLSESHSNASVVLNEAYQKGLEKAQEEAEVIQKEAEAKGYEEGLKKAEAKVEKDFKNKLKTEFEPLVKTMQEMKEVYEAKQNELISRSEDELIQASMGLAKSVIEVESKLNVDVLKERLSKALSYLRTEAEIWIRMHPDDISKIKDFFNLLIENSGSKADVIWKEDPSMSPACFKVISGQSQVSFNSELQWDKLLNELHDKGLAKGVD
ncbi:MAG: hypothetical protein HQL32_15665 [Planctomycetes bacterium]|nr:hypothetical protein [Planctomycetota bacterium]